MIPFRAVIVITLLAGCQAGKDQLVKKLSEPVAVLYNKDLKPFYHRVGSGERLSDRGVIWTRASLDLEKAKAVLYDEETLAKPDRAEHLAKSF
jgi:phosphodiesterase/alkaline phosphatase D-like protein